MLTSAGRRLVGCGPHGCATVKKHAEREQSHLLCIFVDMISSQADPEAAYRAQLTFYQTWWGPVLVRSWSIQTVAHYLESMMSVISPEETRVHYWVWPLEPANRVTESG